uniref:Uncharacterized protein n=1 Tax=Anguilla anguilla TaxID=7936 RepID=A0A0E9SC56_ANGAN
MSETKRSSVVFWTDVKDVWKNAEYFVLQQKTKSIFQPFSNKQCDQEDSPI